MRAGACTTIHVRRQQQHGPLAARLAAALPPEAQQLHRDARGWLDAADAFIAAVEGLTAAQACSRARNVERWGNHWPDRPAFADPTTTSTADDPLAVIEAAEAVAAALRAADAQPRLARAEADEIDTQQLARQLRVTRRRAQQLRSEAIELARRGQTGFDWEGGAA